MSSLQARSSSPHHFLSRALSPDSSFPLPDARSPWRNLLKAELLSLSLSLSSLLSASLCLALLSAVSRSLENLTGDNKSLETHTRGDWLAAWYRYGGLPGWCGGMVRSGEILVRPSVVATWHLVRPRWQDHHLRSPGKIPTPKLKFTSKPTESLSGSMDQMYGPDVGIAAKQHKQPTGQTLPANQASKQRKYVRNDQPVP